MESSGRDDGVRRTRLALDRSSASFVLGRADCCRRGAHAMQISPQRGLSNWPRIRFHHDCESVRNIAARLAMPDRFDVIIAGGGVIGASIAWRPARTHRRVLLLDASRIGVEASSAAAGMLAPGGEFEEPSPLLTFATESLVKYDGFIAAIKADSGLPVEF